jgi:hypothetical protein
MNNVSSAVTRISRFRHGEGGAERGDALISMADIAPSAFPSIAGERRESGTKKR